jgi:hypothetical protein
LLNMEYNKEPESPLQKALGQSAKYARF